MPFRGLRDGVIVVPANVPNQEPVTCPECGDTMYPRGGQKQVRHFYHVNCHSKNSCPTTATDESATHALCVALAVTALKKQFKDQAERYGAEITLDVSDSGSGNKTRQADALLQFKEENPYFGRNCV